MCRSIAAPTHDHFFVDAGCHPQTIAVVQTRASGLGITIIVGDPMTADFAGKPFCGTLLAYPATDGSVRELRGVAERALVQARGSSLGIQRWPAGGRTVWRWSECMPPPIAPNSDPD